MGPMHQQFANGQKMALGQGGLAPTALGERLDGDTARRHAILELTIEQDVIPRLLLTRRDLPQPEVAITAAQVARLVSLLLGRDGSAATSFVGGLHAGGVPAETLCLRLLTPAARRLGQMWVDDECDFTDVTIGCFALQDALRALGVTGVNAPTAPRILLAPLPGGQHSLGVLMVEGFFRRAGWSTTMPAIDSEADLADAVRSAWFNVVGLSLPCSGQEEDARAAIRTVRRASLNTAVRVVVGGPAVLADPGLATSIGADGVAADGRQAVEVAGALLAPVADRRWS